MTRTNVLALIARAWQRSFPLVLSLFILAPFAVFAQGAPVDPGNELAPAVEALSKAFASGGTVNWIIAAPAIVWLVVFATRKWVAAIIPGPVGEWLRSRVGGIVLAVLFGLATSFLDFALTGGKFTVAAVLGILFKALYGFLGGMGIQTAQKNVRQQLAGEANAQETAIATLERVGKSGAGPQP